MTAPVAASVAAASVAAAVTAGRTKKPATHHDEIGDRTMRTCSCLESGFGSDSHKTYFSTF